jgi:WD40-like Beta Propeller Repeat
VRQSVMLLVLIASFIAAPGASVREAETFGDWSTPRLVAELNTGSNDMYAVLTRDELTVYITSNRSGGSGGDDLWYATRPSVDSPWGTPNNMGSINSGAADALPTLSYDEHTMFFYSTRPSPCGPENAPGDIWMTRRRDARSQEWELPKNLGCVLNTQFAEIAPAFFEDPQTEQAYLFYGSNRGGDLANFDVYVSMLNDDGSATAGVLVPEFSSPRRDTRIFIRRDGLEAFVTSDRTDVGSQGMIDIWTTTRETLSDQWATPLVSLPSPVNSSCDDGSPFLSRDGTTLYFFSNRGDGGPCVDRNIWYTTRVKIQQEISSQPSLAALWKWMVARLNGSPSS